MIKKEKDNVKKPSAVVSKKDLTLTSSRSYGNNAGVKPKKMKEEKMKETMRSISNTFVQSKSSIQHLTGSLYLKKQ